MKTLLTKIGVVIATFLLLDMAFGMLLNKTLEMSPDGRYYKATYTLAHSKDDIVILGSSRAETNYVPYIFEDAFGLSCWNAGRGGQGLAFWHALNLGMLERHSPKMVILNIEYDFLGLDPGNASFERAGFLRPFYKNYPAIRPIIDKISVSEKFLVKSNLYAFNSSYYYLLRPFIFKGVDGLPEEKGWKPLRGKMVKSNKEKKVLDESAGPLDPRYVKMINEFVDVLVAKGTKVIFCLGPDYMEKVINTPTLEYVRNMENVRLINLSLDKNLTENPRLYRDDRHLNEEGAIMFSKLLVSEMEN